METGIGIPHDFALVLRDEPWQTPFAHFAPAPCHLPFIGCFGFKRGCAVVHMMRIDVSDRSEVGSSGGSDDDRY